MIRSTKLTIIPVLLIFLSHTGFCAEDPIIGCWTMDPEYGAYQHEYEIKDNGVVIITFFGDTASGTWEKSTDEKYLFRPSAEDDYFLLQNQNLASYDSEGFIRSFYRAMCQ